MRFLLVLGTLLTPFTTHAVVTKNARSKLSMKPLSVVDKKITPPSGDKRDYLSLAPYFWPDPSKPDGKPYLRKDGKVNPESRDDSSDNIRLTRMMTAIEILADAYKESQDEAFAQKASAFIKIWFLDPETSMKPNLNFAQGVPGKYDGRCFGIIEGSHLLKAASASRDLKDSPHWNDQDDKALRDWMTQYLDWLLTSPLGKEEGSRKNNHATGYDVQIIQLATFLNRDDLVKKVLSEVKSRRIDVQIEPDGSQPGELKRTKSLNYTRLNLKFFFDLAKAGEAHDIDLWNYQSEDGRSLRKALDFMTPYLLGARKGWPYQQIDSTGPSSFYRLYQEAARAYQEPLYLEIARKLRTISKW
ncbi:alginate lyase family protein [Verrucomicrobiaceae bacterium 227]